MESVSARTLTFPHLQSEGEKYPILSSAGPEETKETVEVSADSVALFSVIVRNLHNSPRKSYFYNNEAGIRERIKSPEWGITIEAEEALNPLNISFGVGEEESLLEPSAISSLLIKSGNSVVAKKSLSAKIFPIASAAIIKVKIDKEKVSLFGGEDSRTLLWEGTTPFSPRRIGVFTRPGSKIELLHASLCQYPLSIIPLYEKRDIREIDEYLSRATQPLEGYWALLDASYEQNTTLIGGDYLLACIAAEGGRYDLVYLAGAKAGEWTEGMIKGTLHTTAIPEVYTVDWRLPNGKNAEEKVKAQLDNGILTFYFIESEATLRFQAVEGNPYLR